MKAGSHRLTFAGILNALDGIAGQTGRMVFMSTNHKERLDPALIRPGRVDYEIEFAAATREQTKQLFVNFYRRLSNCDDSSKQSAYGTATIAEPLSPTDAVDLVDGSDDHIFALAERFANAIPEHKHTMSQIQGICMGYRGDPEGVVQHVETVQRKAAEQAAERAATEQASDVSGLSALTPGDAKHQMPQHAPSSNLAENGDDDATDSDPLFSTAVKLPSLSRQLSGGGGSSSGVSTGNISSNDSSLAAFGGGNIHPPIRGPPV